MIENGLGTECKLLRTPPLTLLSFGCWTKLISTRGEGGGIWRLL